MIENCDGAENMRRDSGMLDQCNGGGGNFLRVYRWSRPTLSLGYFQKLEDVADSAFMAANGVDWVRRPTGGGAILHDRELTYSLALPLTHPASAGSINDSYLNLTRPLLELLRNMGISAEFRGDCKTQKTANCFAGSACPDIVVAGNKVFGSAQRRKEKAMLMHGSLLFSVDEALWRGVFGKHYGAGFAGVGHAEDDWESLLSEAYSRALNLEFVAARVAP